MSYFTYTAQSGLAVTQIGAYDYILSDNHIYPDEDILYDDYGVGNGGYVGIKPYEYDWFLEMDWKNLDHGIKCKCKNCKAYWLPVKMAAKEWLRKNSIFAPQLDDLNIGVTKLLKMRGQNKGIKKNTMTNEEIDKQIALLERMKQDNDLTNA